MSEIFSVLADPTRRAILVALAAGPQTVSQLVTVTNEGQPTVSKHLKTLREAGLVSAQAAGQARVYSIELAPLAAAQEFIAQIHPGSAPLVSQNDIQEALGDAGEKLGGLLAAGTTWLNAQIAAKVADSNLDVNKLGKDLGRRLADAKSVAAEVATGTEQQVRNEVSQLSSMLGAKVAEARAAVFKPKFTNENPETD
jgi:DNA-binding transcriptional ArsR family regulator